MNDPYNVKSPPLLFLESRTPAPTHSLPPKTSLRKQLSPLRYPGGKSRVIDQIAAHLNRDRLEQFVEVFAGGASLGLSLLNAGWVKTLELNEYDPLVYNFWNTILAQPQGLIDQLQGPLPTLPDYFQAKERSAGFKLPGSGCDVGAAYDFLLLNRTSFGGIILANPIGGKNGSDEEMRVRWNPQTLTKRISRIAEMRDSIRLTNEDAVDFLSVRTFKHNVNATYFIDPPYTRVGKKLYPESFVGRHGELAEAVHSFMSRNPKTDVILTYDDCSLVRSLYPDAEVKTLSTRWSIYREKTEKAAG